MSLSSNIIVEGKANRGTILVRSAPATSRRSPVVEAPRRLTLTFGGFTQERRGREHKVVEHMVRCGIMRWQKHEKGMRTKGVGKKSSKIELIE